MAKLQDLKIKYEIEPIVKLTCMSQCKNRLRNSFSCNLKRLTISTNGKCNSFEALKEVTT